MSFTRAASQAAIMARASAELLAIGFSQSTCLPAAAAASTCSRCKPLGVTAYTARTSPFSRRRCMSA
jgi:hypothetical protein